MTTTWTRCGRSRLAELRSPELPSPKLSGTLITVRTSPSGRSSYEPVREAWVGGVTCSTLVPDIPSPRLADW